MSAPPGAGTGIRLVFAALGWVYRQTFKLAPPVWLLIAILAAAASVALVSVQPLAAIPVVVVAVGAGAALMAWLGLGRPHGNRLLAFLCPFDELSADATRIAPLQVRALGDRIAADPCSTRPSPSVDSDSRSTRPAPDACCAGRAGTPASAAKSRPLRAERGGRPT